LIIEIFNFLIQQRVVMMMWTK